MHVLCPCKRAYDVHVFEEDPETGCATKEGFYLSCPCIKDIRVSCMDQQAQEELLIKTHKYLIKERIQGLLQEKTRVLYDHGIWPWNKEANQKHKEINHKLEALGAYQGKYH